MDRDRQQRAELEQAYAEDAKMLLDHPAFIRTFERLKEQYISEWLAMPAADVAALHAVKLKQDGLTAFRNDLEAVRTAGRIAERNLGASRASHVNKNLNKNV